jgi:hypothetical protein
VEHRDRRNAHRLLVGIPAGKSPLGRSTRRWVIISKMVLRDIEFRDVDCIHGAKSRNAFCRHFETEGFIFQILSNGYLFFG